MKKLITICLMMAAVFVAKAQAHISTGKYVCNLVPKSRGTEKYLCPACEKIDEKERNARKVEDKKRSDANDAKILADKKAAEALKLEKQRIAKEAEKRAKDKEAADKIASENAQKRYKEILAGNLIKSNVKGQDVDLSKIESFQDDKRKVFGFKLNNEELITFPFDDEKMSIRRIDGSNLFTVNVYGSEKYSYLIDITGKRIVLDGKSKAYYGGITSDEKSKVIYFSINHSTESIERVVLPNNAIGNFYKTKEAAIADVKYNNSKGGSAGLAMFVTPVIFFNTRYILDFNGRVLEKSEGYFVGQKY